MDAGRRNTAWKAFRDVWVAGTVGGFLAALMRSIPLDAASLRDGADGLFVFDLLLRYGYIFWFVAYFVISNLNKANLRQGEVAFDILQSAVAFAAAFALGIAVRGEGYQYARSSAAFDFANGAILTISLVSLLLFGRRDSKHLNLLRLAGAAIAVGGLLVSHGDPLSAWRLTALAAGQLALGVLIVLFGRHRIAELPG